jgi:hypothetical protein
VRIASCPHLQTQHPARVGLQAEEGAEGHQVVVALAAEVLVQRSASQLVHHGAPHAQHAVRRLPNRRMSDCVAAGFAATGFNSKLATGWDLMKPVRPFDTNFHKYTLRIKQ